MMWDEYDDSFDVDRWLWERDRRVCPLCDRQGGHTPGCPDSDDRQPADPGDSTLEVAVGLGRLVVEERPCC